MTGWPSWRFERALDEAETKESLRKIAEAKEEAEHALQVSQAQVETVKRITEEHKPVRLKMRSLREDNHFAQGFRRVIEEGR